MFFLFLCPLKKTAPCCFLHWPVSLRILIIYTFQSWLLYPCIIPISLHWLVFMFYCYCCLFLTFMVKVFLMCWEIFDHLFIFKIETLKTQKIWYLGRICWLLDFTVEWSGRTTNLLGMSKFHYLYTFFLGGVLIVSPGNSLQLEAGALQPGSQSPGQWKRNHKFIYVILFSVLNCCPILSCYWCVHPVSRVWFI